MKILILIDSLDTGGAETHVELLSRELLSEGQEVYVASSGGALSEKLIKYGIHSFLIRGFSKLRGKNKITHFIRSLPALRKNLKELIKIIKPDIVHAHTRKTAFLMHRICKKYKIPLIVTAHAKFEMTFPKKIFSRWGDFTISVSEDIKNHLEKHKIPSNKVTVINNGVTIPEALTEYSANSKTIVFVSRLDGDSSLGAHLLCNIASVLADKIKDLNIIIVGGGTEFSKIHKRAQIINQKHNRKLISTVGRVENPSIYFSSCALFVGVSRAALEAMAYGLPVILLGNEGYLGLLDENKLGFAQKTNFTCRGYGDINDVEGIQKTLTDEILRFFRLTNSEKVHLSELSYETVKDGHSVKNMVRETLEFYRICLGKYAKFHRARENKAKKVAVCGYYGHKNLGDEAILNIIKEKILSRNPDVKIRVLYGKNPLKIIKYMLGADYFIFGGGSLLQNSTSNSSFFFYLFIIRLANVLCGKKIMLSNGIGPIEKRGLSCEALLRASARTINSFDYISVRDGESKALLENLLPHRKIHLLPDPAVVYCKNINRQLKNAEGNGCFIYVPCSGGLSRSKISTDAVISVLKRVQMSFKLPLVIAVLNQTEDMVLAREVAKMLKNTKIICPNLPEELFESLKCAGFVISQRYHGTLFATCCNVPTLAVSNDPKMHSLCKDLGIFPCHSTILLTDEEKIAEKICECLKYGNEFEQSREILKKKTEIFERKIENLLENF